MDFTSSLLFVGFDLGSTIQSKTKGIWVWCRPHPKKAGQCLLLLDTEGLGDVEKVGLRKISVKRYKKYNLLLQRNMEKNANSYRTVT